MWIPLILASAAGLGLYDICKKHAVHDNAVMPVLFLATLCGSAAFLLALAFTGHFAAAAVLGAADWWRVVLKTLLVSGSWVLVYYGMRALPISLASPIRASAPVWTLLGAVALFHENPTPGQWAGMGVTFAGYYLFSVLGRKEGISFTRHAGILWMFLGTLLGAASALYDKHLLQVCKIPRESMQFWFSVDLVAVLGAALLFQRSAALARTRFEWRWTIPLTGILLVAADWLYFKALSDPHTRISVLSLIRRSNVLISFTAGALIFRDANFGKKACALAAVLAGIAVLCLAKN